MHTSTAIKTGRLLVCGPAQAASCALAHARPPPMSLARQARLGDGEEDEAVGACAAEACQAHRLTQVPQLLLLPPLVGPRVGLQLRAGRAGRDQAGGRQAGERLSARHGRQESGHRPGRHTGADGKGQAGHATKCGTVQGEAGPATRNHTTQRESPTPSLLPLTWLSGCTSSSPTSCPRGAAKLRKVDATKTPPGRSTRDTSASAADGLGQQWMAAPACTAATAAQGPPGLELFIACAGRRGRKAGGGSRPPRSLRPEPGPGAPPCQRRRKLRAELQLPQARGCA